MIRSVALAGLVLLAGCSGGLGGDKPSTTTDNRLTVHDNGSVSGFEKQERKCYLKTGNGTVFRIPCSDSGGGSDDGKRLSDVINDLLGPDEPLIERISTGPPCPECGERSDPSEIETELVGSGLKAYRCPKCSELI